MRYVLALFLTVAITAPALASFEQEGKVEQIIGHQTGGGIVVLSSVTGTISACTSYGGKGWWLGNGLSIWNAVQKADREGVDIEMKYLGNDSSACVSALGQNVINTTFGSTPPLD